MWQTISDFVSQAVFIPKPHFMAEDIPDLSGKVMIVTGGNAGIGKETVKELLRKNAKVYLAARNKEKAEKAIEELRETTGREAVFLELDLADLKSIRRAVRSFLSQESRLDVLFNNAGVMIPPISLLTADGYDLQFGTNVLGHYYLTKLLLPLMVASAKSSPNKKARVVHTSSSGHLFVRGIDFDTLKVGRGENPVGEARRWWKGTGTMYAQSKYGNVVMSNEFARRYADQGIVSISLNPGNIKSELQRHVFSFVRFFTEFFIYPTSLGAITQLWAGTAPETADMNGKYLVPWAREGRPLPGTRDVVLGEKLWEWLEDQVKSIDEAE